ncbi:MAG: sensor histidine kinase [Eubacteriales bacterium]
MGKSLIRKFFMIFIIIILSSYIILITFTYNAIEGFLINERKRLLEKETTIITNQYLSQYYLDEINIFNIEHLLQMLDNYFDIRIWFVDKHGSVIADSRDNLNRSNSLDITNLDENLLYRRFSMVGDFYGYFDNTMITVGTPIIANNTLQGAIFFHSDISDIKKQASSIFRIGFITLASTLSISAVLIYLYTRKIVNPLREMNKAAIEYSNGDFEKTLQVKSKDEIGQLAESLNNMAYELSKTEEFRRSFIANISHDFRSPLTSIKGYVGAILDGTISKDEQDKYLSVVIDETERLNKLTSDILFLTSMETQGLNLNYISFDIHHVIRKVAKLFEHKCSQKNISVKLKLDNEELLVSADIDKIQQVLYNLFDNSVKFTNADSQIIIETTKLNNKVYVSIKDYGQGIPKEQLNHIWDRFYKSDPSRGIDKKGTGLGLSIVKEIIKAHNETIRVFSTEGIGTEFVFTLNLKN